MAPREIYTRVYSPRSAGALISGEGALFHDNKEAEVSANDLPDQLSRGRLLDEFRSHSILHQEEHTALVSVSTRIIDTVARAWNKYQRGNESPADIWICFIEDPAALDEPLDKRVRCHRAEPLARDCGHAEPWEFHHEVVFEHAVPKECLLHKVALETFIARWLDWKKYIDPEGKGLKLPTSVLRERISSDLLHRDPWDVGLELGCFARTFGVKAPGDWIAHQLFDDCVQQKKMGNKVRFEYAHEHSETHGADFAETLLEVIDCGIETTIDWWLEDLKAFEEWRDIEQDIEEDRMLWDMVDFWETWYPSDDRNMFWAPFDVEDLSYDDEWEKLQTRRSEFEDAIMEEAVKVGF